MLRTLSSVIQANIVLFPVLIALNGLLFVVWLVGSNSGPFFTTLVQSGKKFTLSFFKELSLSRANARTSKKGSWSQNSMLETEGQKP